MKNTQRKKTLLAWLCATDRSPTHRKHYTGQLHSMTEDQVNQKLQPGKNLRKVGLIWEEAEAAAPD